LATSRSLGAKGRQHACLFAVYQGKLRGKPENGSVPEWRVAPEVSTSFGQDVPVIFLTARDATEDKIRGLTLGGDDYVTKPFSLEEVVARIRAVLRRTGGSREEGASKLRYADLEMDEDSHEVRRGGP